MVQEITRDFLAEKSIEYAEQKDSGAWANDCEGFVAGAMFVMQLLKQANVSRSQSKSIVCPTCGTGELHAKNGYIWCRNKKCQAIFEPVPQD